MKKLIFSSIFMMMLFCSTTTAIADDSKYRIGPGDSLEISVWKDESLTREVIVPPDGVISYPLVGDIDAAGMTITELRKNVTEKLYEYVPDATVTVMIRGMNSLKAYVIGNVHNPGEFSITMNTSVMQLLAMARGLNPFASTGKIHILRQKKNFTVTIPFNYKQVAKGENLKQNVLIQRGDVVVVP